MLDWDRHLGVNLAADCVRTGGVIAYPTEAVWGLGCDPDDAEAVGQILRLKGRSVIKGLIMVAADIEQFQPYLEGLDSELLNKMQSTWPGPVTWLVPDNGVAPDWICGKHRSLALRVSDHPLVAALCRRVGGPLVSTSANPQGREAARSRLEVRRFFRDKIDYYAPGEVSGRANPSQIRDLLSDKILR